MIRFVNVSVFIPYKYCNIFKPSHPSYTHPPMKMEETECSETSAYKIHTPENYQEKSIQHSEHGGSLKSRIPDTCLQQCHCADPNCEVFLLYVYVWLP